MNPYATLFKQGKTTAEFIATGTPEQIAELERCWQAKPRPQSRR